MILLPGDRFAKLKELIHEVQINNLFARSVIEKHVTGEIFVDDIDNPKTIYVIHPYGMSLLFGNYSNVDFNNQFKSNISSQTVGEITYEWLQTYPEGWDEVMNNLFGDMIIKHSENNFSNGLIELNTRVNFNFNKEKYQRLKKKVISEFDLIVETTQVHFDLMPGSVIPMKFWDSSEDFLQQGKGFTMLHNGEIASTAYSAYVHEDKLEIGIETIEKYRGLGLAELTCSRLIDYCIDNNLIPVWSCRYENIASYNLAIKLGFEPTTMIPYYKIKKVKQAIGSRE